MLEINLRVSWECVCDDFTKCLLRLKGASFVKILCMIFATNWKIWLNFEMLNS